MVPTKSEPAKGSFPVLWGRVVSFFCTSAKVTLLSGLICSARHTRKDYDMMLGDVLILNGWDGFTGDYMPSIKIMFDFGWHLFLFFGSSWTAVS